MRCSTSLSRYLSAYPLDSAKIKSITSSQKRRRKKSTGALQDMLGNTPGVALNVGNGLILLLFPGREELDRSIAWGRPSNIHIST